MQTILFNILLLLIVVWVFIGILFLWQQFRIACRRLEKACEKKNEQKQKQNVSSVTQDQLEQVRQVLVGKSKSYREQYETLSKEVAVNSRKSQKFPLFPPLKIQMKNLILLQRKTHLCPKKQKKWKVQKRTMKCRLTIRWTNLTKTLLSVRNCKSPMQ